MAKLYLKVGFALAEGVGGDAFLYPRDIQCVFNSALQGGFMNMMAGCDACLWICVEVGGREDVLPDPLFVGVWEFLI